MNSSAHPKRKVRSSNGKGSASVARQRYKCSLVEGDVTRQTYYVRHELLEKIQGYAYWERYGISELINQILEEFFEDKEVRPKPPRKRVRYRR